MAGFVLTQYQRTNGVIAMGHRELVQTLGHDKSNISHSLYTLASRGLIVIDRTPGGKADSLHLTAEGRKVASKIT
jgi:DNA-binding MarR family transcriptional regulator